MLHINLGSIDLATQIDTALLAYVAFLAASHELVGRILSNLSESLMSSEQEAMC